MKNLRKSIIMSLSTIICTVPSGILAASYNCENSSNASEIAICSNSELSHLDDELNTLYKSLIDAPPIAQEVHRTQQAWLAKRNSCGKNVKCLRSSYKKRIKFLGDTYVD